MLGERDGTNPEVPENPVPPAPAVPKAGATVRAVVDAYLGAKKGAVKAPTHYVYNCLLKHVTGAFGDQPAAGLRAGDVLRWLYGLTLSPSTRSDIAGVLASVFKWADTEGVIPANPLRGLKRPPGESRGAKAVVTEDVHRRLMDAANPALRLLLTFLRETGCRPSELARLTAADIDLANGVATLRDHKTAHTTGRPRFIFLTPVAVALLKEQAAVHPTGPVHRSCPPNSAEPGE